MKKTTRGRPKVSQADPEVEIVNDNPPDPMRELMGLIKDQRDMIAELREELREERAKKNEERGQSTQEETQEETRQEETAEGSARPLESPPHTALNQEPHGVVVREERDMQYWVAKFCKHLPPVFKGRFDPQAAEDWLNRLEKIFEVLECPPEVKARLAVYKLEGDADRWWRNISLTLRSRNVPLTWELFQQEFNEKYFPKSVRLEKETEFLNIKQGDTETFDDYLSRFVRLSRYSSYLRNMDDEEWSSDMLIRGLRRNMKKRLVTHMFTKFNKAVEECRITENNLRELYPAKGTSSRSEPNKPDTSQKRKGQGFTSEGSGKRPYQSEGRGDQRPPVEIVCPQCRKYHPGRTCTGQVICFICKQRGHISTQCPQLQKEQRPRTQGRVFTMTHEEARKSPDLIQGKLYLTDSLSTTLSDMGAR